MAALEASAPDLRPLDVAIFGADGTNLLRDRSGGRYVLTGLQFETTLPGGFGAASFSLTRPAAVAWPGETGLTVEIRRGRTVLWWGWLEDVMRRQRGRIEEIQVTGLGPWQQVGERLLSVGYTGTLDGDVAIGQELAVYCDEISLDRSQLTPTGMNIAPLTWSNQPVSDLVKLVCDAGDSSGRPLLFAVWEPTYRSTNGYPASLASNSDAESGSSTPSAWYFAVVSGNPQSAWCTDVYNSVGHGLKIYRGAGAGDQVGRWYQTDIPCTAGTTYTFDYWLYWPAVASIYCYLEAVWYDSGGGYLSTSYTTTRTSTGAAGGTRYVETLTAPASAHHFTLRCRALLPDTVGALAVFDDVYVYTPGSAPAVDRRPRAYLWPRNLSEYDYKLHTAELATGLQITRSTRELANAVLASYGSASFTTFAQDMASQAAYRRRDRLVAAGNVDVTVAEAIRDAVLAQAKTPAADVASFTLAQPGAVRMRHGTAAHPTELRAGHRLLVADGPEAGLVALVTRTAYADGAMTYTLEAPADVGMLLAERGSG